MTLLTIINSLLVVYVERTSPRSSLVSSSSSLGDTTTWLYQVSSDCDYQYYYEFELYKNMNCQWVNVSTMTLHINTMWTTCLTYKYHVNISVLNPILPYGSIDSILPYSSLKTPYYRTVVSEKVWSRGPKENLLLNAKCRVSTNTTIWPRLQNQRF